MHKYLTARPSRRCLLGVVVSITVLAGTFQMPVRAAQDRKPLPSFRVVASGGSTVDSRVLATLDPLLLVYVGPECLSCDRLLQAMGRWSTPQLIAQTVVLIGADRPAAEAYAQRHLPDAISGIRWYADPDRTAAAALGIATPPALVGVRAGQIEWTVAGVLNDPGLVESVIRRWIGF